MTAAPQIAHQFVFLTESGISSISSAFRCVCRQIRDQQTFAILQQRIRQVFHGAGNHQPCVGEIADS